MAFRGGSVKAIIVLALGAAVGLLACGGGGADPAAPLPTYEEREVLWVNPDELHDWIEAGHADDVVFIDNRTQFVYEEQHIEGARLISTDIVDEAIGTLPLNKWLIMYCT